MNSSLILSQIQRYVSNLFQAQRINLSADNVTPQCLKFFNISGTMSRTKLHYVIWKPPQHGWIKLNCDGACKGNPSVSGGGGVCRDGRANFVFSFHKFSDLHSSLGAETRAVLDGLLLLRNPSITAIWLEIDSLQLVRILSGEAAVPWHLHYYVREIKNILHQYTFFVSHVFREGNVPADGLANEAVKEQSNKVYSSLNELPKKVKGALLLDKLSLPGVQIS